VVSSLHLYNSQVRLGFSLVMHTTVTSFLFGIISTSICPHYTEYNLLCGRYGVDTEKYVVLCQSVISW